MVRIRLTKRGRKKAPAYRIVVANSRTPRDGVSIETIGFYNPSHNPPLFEYDKEKYQHWISKGAQPSKAVVQLIKDIYVFKPYTKETRAEEEKKKQEESQNQEQARKEEEKKKENKKPENNQ